MIPVLLSDREPTDAEIQRAQAQIDRARQGYERWLARRYLRMLRRLRRELSTDPMPSWEDVLIAMNRFRDEQTPVLTAYYDKLFADASEWVGSKGVFPEEVKAKRRRKLTESMRAWIREHIGHRIVQITDDTLRDVQRMYYQADGDAGKFDRAMRRSDTFGPVRSRRIAVTETTIAVNETVERTTTEAAEAVGGTTYKTWRTAGMMNTRPAHQRMNGITIPGDELFRVPIFDGDVDTGGYDLMSCPGDGSHGATAGNIVNCRCMCFYRIKYDK